MWHALRGNKLSSINKTRQCKFLHSWRERIHGIMFSFKQCSSPLCLFLIPGHCALVVQCAQCKMHWLRIFTMYNAPVERMYYANVHWLIRVQCALVGGKPAFQWSIEVSAEEGGKGRPQLGRGRLTESFGASGPQFFCLHMFGLFLGDNISNS